MSTFKKLRDEARRREILNALQRDPDYAMNDGLIQSQIELLGFGVSADTIRADLAWLEEQGLVQVRPVADLIVVAHLTRRGEDVALNRTTIPGVGRGQPGN